MTADRVRITLCFEFDDSTAFGYPAMRYFQSVYRSRFVAFFVVWQIVAGFAHAADNAIPVVAVEGQPLAANAKRLLQALEFLGAPLRTKTSKSIVAAANARDARQLQTLIDPHVLFAVSLNPEVRVKVKRGPATPVLQQGGFTPVLVKILNDSTVTKQLRIVSPQSGPVYSGAILAILKRQAQTELKVNENSGGATDRFLQVEMFQSPPMTTNLNGLEAEYAIALIFSSESGKREATIGFDIGAGNQDLGFRGEVPILFDIRPARAVKLRIRDADGTPTVARLTFRDKQGRVYPPQAKRLAPDFFFQPQIYREDGDVVLLPPGKFTMDYSRGPEYKVLRREVLVPAKGPLQIEVNLQRWINPIDYGFYCGDHHIHGAGCSHYDSPTKGVTPDDMFLQVKGEGLNVGCVLTWGPCFDFQRNYFSPTAASVSEPMTLLKYDLEISGFGSAALGHVCLLNLKNQNYPNSEGTKTKGWPTWTVPVLRWTKQQGGVTGYPHSAMHVNPSIAAGWLLEQYDKSGDKRLSPDEAKSAVLPASFEKADEDTNGFLTNAELAASSNRAADMLPNLALPSMNGAGAMEICVSTAEGVCDFISAMDTARIPEWNTWYHIMNCGFPLKLSGETDFPCMSSRRVGQGRVYVQLGDVERVDFRDWCNSLAKGRSYVSDGFAHALRFTVNGQSPGFESVSLQRPGKVTVNAKVSFAAEIPKAVAYGGIRPSAGRRMVGDTINLHAPRSDETIKGGKRRVELVVNGTAVVAKDVPGDGRAHNLEFTVDVASSSWIAIRQFPQLHTNPVNVIVAGKPIRASRQSALWCAETIKLLWRNRNKRIAQDERQAAYATYQRSIQKYLKIAEECAAGS